MRNLFIRHNFLATFKSAPAVFFCWCLFLLPSCKDPAIEDTELLTGDDALGLAKDTLSVNVFSAFEQPVIGNSIATGLLGNIDDPNFGKTLAGFYGQCRLSLNNVNFGNNPVLDSAFMTFRYSGKYGAFDIPVDVNVFELAQSLDTTSYKINDAFQVKLPPIGQIAAFLPKITDSVNVYNVAYAPHLRVRLSNSFGNKILAADSSDLADNTAFLALFKGFYVTCSSASSGNGAVYLDLKSSISGLTIYYHNDAEDSLTYLIPISGITVSHIDNHYTGSAVSASVNNPNPGGEEKMFLQGGAGTYGKIQITDLDSLPKNIAVNKAELIFTQNSSDTQYTAPLLLDLFRIDDSGNPQNLEDVNLSHFGGVRQTEFADGAAVVRYRFNIKKYFQRLVDGKYNNNGFYLKTINPGTNTERVVIANSATNPTFKVKLIITYTKL